MAQEIEMVRVPLEPTAKMQQAGRDAIYAAQKQGWAGLDVIDIWKVMASAALDAEEPK